MRGHLGDTEAEWKTIVEQNSKVATTFSTLGVETSARRLYHADATALANCHTVLDLPLLADPPLERFASMAKGL